MRSVSEKGFVTIDSCAYSVPIQYCNQTVETYKTDAQLFIYREGTKQEIARHTLSLRAGVKIVDKGHFRHKAIPLNDLIAKTRDLHSFSSWNTFCERNNKAFPRYVRDQCLEAQKLFKQKIDTATLERAVTYCLSNNTLSMKELFDTYSHFLHEHQGEEDLIHHAFPRFFCGSRQSLQVAKRNVSAYESVIDSPKGAGI